MEYIEELECTVKQLRKENDALKDFAIWMTGCGYDFCQHEYFREQRDKLLLKCFGREAQ